MSEDTEDCNRLHVTHWSRSNFWNASQTAGKIFASFNIAVVVCYTVFNGKPDFELAFWIGFAAAALAVPAYMIFKLNPQVEQ
jgi:hypothetical protein